ncbi:MAG TPA: acyl-CoA dehydratase activase [Syntrophorhabdaceae bacterium]|nr:acyl-CoA dehydratase activase [Syntrophorhabdaceae bacterium]
MRTEMNQYFAGVDIGSTMTKVVIVNEGLRASVVGPTGPEHRKLADKVMEEALEHAHLAFDDLTYIIATGYGRINVPFADKQITEITCHAKGLHSLLPTARTIIDIGGQDSKGIRIKNGKVIDFVMNDKCAAGTGRFLEIIADALNVPLDALGALSVSAEKVTPIANTCTVFAEQEVVSQLANGEPLASLTAGIHDAVAARICAMVNKLKIEQDVAVTGGGAKNIGLVKALEKRFGFALLVPHEPLLTGALGAALMAKELFQNAWAKGEKLKRSGEGLKEASLFL